VTHVVNAGAFAYDKDDSISYLDLPVQNTPDSDISRHFAACNGFIHAAVKGGEGLVLVHCRAGRSRTATLVCAYLIAHRGLCVEQALDTVRAARPSSKPIDAFMLQLLDYCRKLPVSKDEHGEGLVQTARAKPRSLGQVTYVPKHGERRRGSIFSRPCGGMVISSQAGLAFQGVAAWLGHVEREVEAERRAKADEDVFSHIVPTSLFPFTPPADGSPPVGLRTGLLGMDEHEARELKACLMGSGLGADIAA